LDAEKKQKEGITLPSKTRDSSEDIEDVLADLARREMDISRNSFGPTEKREAGPPVGSTTSSIDALLDLEKPFDITARSILFSSVFLILGISIGCYFQQRYEKTIFSGGHRFVLSGMAQSNAGKESIFFPVYKEIKK
jgi:hypothetical protein